MRNIKLLIAYDGTAYAGWQRQALEPTIQGTLEAALAVLTRQPVILHGAGRTDAGVHALGMVANFLTPATIPAHGLLRGGNSLLPDDIRLLMVEEAALDFQARFHAKGKSYRYQFINRPFILPHQRLYYTHIPARLDLSAMAAALATLIGEHDFASFEASGSRDPNVTGGRGSVRRITTAELGPQGDGLAIRLEGDGFLRHMVRNIAGTVFEVGLGRRTVADFQAILRAKDRKLAAPTAPARGLFLEEVLYD